MNACRPTRQNWWTPEPGADVGEVLDRHVAAERRRVAEDGVVADVAVVGDVDVGHEDVAIADRRHAAAAARAAVDRHELAEDVAPADHEARLLAAKLQVLRNQPDRRERVDLRIVADLGPAVDDRRGADPAVRADAHVGADRRVRADRRALADLRAAGARSPSDRSRSDRRRCRAAARLPRRADRRRYAAACARASDARRRPSETSSRSRSPGTTCRRNFASFTPRR